MEPTDWAPEHSGALRELFAQHLSFGRITEAINRKFNTNYSRSAVLGRARRMGLAGSKQSVLPSWEQQPQLNRPREAHLVDPPALRVRWPVPPPMEMEPVKLRCVELEPRLK